MRQQTLMNILLYTSLVWLAQTRYSAMPGLDRRHRQP